LAFMNAFHSCFTESNIRGGFRGAGLVPYDPETVLSQLSIRFRTPTPVESLPEMTVPWTCKTPHTASEATSQSTLIKTRIVRHQGSSPTSILGAVDQLTRGTAMVMHKLVLMQDRIKELEEANRTLSKRRRQKKIRIREGGPLTLDTAKSLLDQKDLDAQLAEEVRTNRGARTGTRTTQRRCGTCGQTGHNARTCQEDAEMSNVYSSE
jgi:hypothetical protein